MSENPSALIIGALSADSGDTLAAEKGEQLVSRLASHLAARATSEESRELLLESLALVLNGLAAWLLRPRSSAELPAEA